jgi:hypothetical protein
VYERVYPLSFPGALNAVEHAVRHVYPQTASGRQTFPLSGVAVRRFIFPSHSPCKLAFAALFPIFFTDLQPSSQNICLATVDLITRSLYLLAALHPLRLAEADPHSLSTHCQAGFDPWRQGEHMAFSR